MTSGMCLILDDEEYKGFLVHDWAIAVSWGNCVHSSKTVAQMNPNGTRIADSRSACKVLKNTKEFFYFAITLLVGNPQQFGFIQDRDRHSLP
jgi:hypothetical protein